MELKGVGPTGFTITQRALVGPNKPHNLSQSLIITLLLSLSLLITKSSTLFFFIFFFFFFIFFSFQFSPISFVGFWAILLYFFGFEALNQTKGQKKERDGGEVSEPRNIPDTAKFR